MFWLVLSVLFTCLVSNRVCYHHIWCCSCLGCVCVCFCWSGHMSTNHKFPPNFTNPPSLRRINIYKYTNDIRISDPIYDLLNFQFGTHFVFQFSNKFWSCVGYCVGFCLWIFIPKWFLPVVTFFSHIYIFTERYIYKRLVHRWTNLKQ